MENIFTEVSSNNLENKKNYFKFLKKIKKNNTPVNSLKILFNNKKHHKNFNRDIYGLNKFQPNEIDVFFLEDLYINNLSINTWFNIIKNSNFLNIQKNKLNLEQEIRAIECVQKFKDSDTIILLDGYGIIVYFMIKYFIELNIKIPKIIIVEKDEVTHKWHKLFFPKEIKCIKDNIFNLIKLHNNCGIYLNFCGIGDNMNDLKNINCNHFMLSFSTRSKNKESKQNINNIITDNYITCQYLDFNQMLGGNPEPKKYDLVMHKVSLRTRMLAFRVIMTVPEGCCTVPCKLNYLIIQLSNIFYVSPHN